MLLLLPISHSGTIWSHTIEEIDGIEDVTSNWRDQLSFESQLVENPSRDPMEFLRDTPGNPEDVKKITQQSQRFVKNLIRIQMKGPE